MAVRRDTASAARMLRILNPAPMHLAFNPAMLDRIDILTPNQTEFALLSRRCSHDDVDADALAALDDATLHAERVPCSLLHTGIRP